MASNFMKRYEKMKTEQEKLKTEQEKKEEKLKTEKKSKEETQEQKKYETKKQLSLDVNQEIDPTSELKNILSRSPRFRLVRYFSERDRIKELITLGANVNIQNEYGETIFMWADECEDLEMLKLAIENGADLNLEDKNGFTVLWRSLLNYRYQIVKFLVENGADVNATVHGDGYTPLMHLVVVDNVAELIELFIQRGAKINLQDEDGWTALMGAAKNNLNLNNVKILIENGADINIKDNEGDTALDIAKSRIDKQIFNFLKTQQRNQKRKKVIDNIKSFMGFGE